MIAFSAACWPSSSAHWLFVGKFLGRPTLFSERRPSDPVFRLCVRHHTRQYHQPVFAFHLRCRALVGLYLSQLSSIIGDAEPRTPRPAGTGSRCPNGMKPLLICLLPFQTLLVSLVGFCGATVFSCCLPYFSAPGCGGHDLMRLVYGLAVLNTLALFFAAAEYVHRCGTVLPAERSDPEYLRRARTSLATSSFAFRQRS